jgi:hypothetical protein
MADGPDRRGEVRATALVLLASVLALAAGVAALVVAIVLLRSAL